MSTQIGIIRIVVLTLALTVFFGMGGVFVLIRERADPALIAVMAGFVGTALGGVLSLLNNTRTAGPVETSTPVTVTNTPLEPIPTEETPPPETARVGLRGPTSTLP